MNKLDELYTKVKAAAAEANRDRTGRAQRNVNEVLSIIFAEMPKLNLIRVRGYTPGFNDGDPCTHSQTVAVDVYDPDELFHDLHYGDEDEQADAKEELNLSGELMDWSCRSYNPQTRECTDNPLPEDPHQAGCIKAREVVDALEDDFEILFDTNFTLDIVRDSNEQFGFRIDREDYDCGY